ncbi:Piso0_003738 [Millerozyma farinosa CBS 7064]|uniref:Alkyl transferase n=1 Tax=Pichia sorbitophila (strain ATCC MYA-4447 / BCRC 22081 / CBS 7064 / NBRC 10061 / NRRL Y-12695) TaxID=559304 RepID=G8YAW2_PICSO|nr:Piso0_003738 [Millerozyma farinosa CBS 7064]CCE84197.1 Piso0_003738 [Millerozyma farinosa CBS 7064]
MSDWLSTFPGYSQLLSTGKKVFGRIIQTGPTPQHVGIVMDGNRRYAKSHKIEIKEGHNRGFEAMAKILELLYECGVKYATMYAFSIENFKRPKQEVNWLMSLAKSRIIEMTQHGELCEKYGIRVQIVGDTYMLPEDVRSILDKVEDMTKNNKRAVLNICFPYTSRYEMTQAVRSVVDKSSKDRDFIIDESAIEDHLYTSDAPPLDLLIRTSGTYRLSDFLLWQCVPSSCAVVFTKKLWPDFTPWDLCKILVFWSFNKYWYGNSNGYSVSYKSTAEEDDVGSIKNDVTPSSSGMSTGFDRYLYDYDTNSDTTPIDTRDSESTAEQETIISDNSEQKSAK